MQKCSAPSHINFSRTWPFEKILFLIKNHIFKILNVASHVGIYTMGSRRGEGLMNQRGGLPPKKPRGKGQPPGIRVGPPILRAKALGRQSCRQSPPPSPQISNASPWEGKRGVTGHLLPPQRPSPKAGALEAVPLPGRRVHTPSPPTLPPGAGHFAHPFALGRSTLLERTAPDSTLFAQGRQVPEWIRPGP